MYCPNCGKQIEENIEFCPYCGGKIAKDRDASNFFTKNKYRNVKITAVLLIAIFLVGRIFNRGEEGGRRGRNNKSI